MMRSTRVYSGSSPSVHPTAHPRAASRRTARPARSSRPVVRLTASAGASSLRSSPRTSPRLDPRIAAHISAHVAAKKALRRNALRDCGQRCVYCATKLDAHSATLDHVVPLARGGAHEVGNLVASCAPCNRLKGDTMPNEFFARNPWAGENFMRYARSVHRTLKRGARRAVSLAYARADLLAA